mgnify:CR=1 FL=1
MYFAQVMNELKNEYVFLDTTYMHSDMPHKNGYIIRPAQL